MRICTFGFCGLFALSMLAEASASIEGENFWVDRLNLTLLARKITVRGRVADIFSVNDRSCDIPCVASYLREQGTSSFQHGSSLTWWQDGMVVTLIHRREGARFSGYMILSATGLVNEHLEFPFKTFKGHKKVVDIGGVDNEALSQTWLILLKDRREFDELIRIAKVQGYKTQFSHSDGLWVMDKNDAHMVMSMVNAHGVFSVMLNLTKGDIR